MDLVEGLAITMATHAEALRAVLGAVRPVKRYLTRVILHGSRVTSLVYWYAVEWGGCEYYVKIYRKWGGDGLLRPSWASATSPTAAAGWCTTRR